MLIVIIVNMCLYLSVQYMLSNHTDVSYMVSERGLFSPRSGTIKRHVSDLFLWNYYNIIITGFSDSFSLEEFPTATTRLKKFSID